MMDRPFGVQPRTRRVMALGSCEYTTVSANSNLTRIWYANSGYQVDGVLSVAGWNDMMDFYSKAWVMGGRLSLRLYTIGGGALFASSTVSTALGTPASVPAGMTSGRCAFGIFSSYGNPLRLDTEWDTAEVLTKPKVLDDAELYGTRASKPPNQIYNYLLLNNPQAVAQTVMIQAEIELTIVFTDPNPVI